MRERQVFDEREYYDWLISQVDDIATSDLLILYRTLWDIPFYWSIERDAGLEENGRVLRRRYCSDTPEVREYSESHPVANVLEIMVALERGMRDVMGDEFEPGHWFHEMITNLGIDIPDDEIDRTFVRETVDRWLRRDFKRNGLGSPFPLLRGRTDQRKKPIWDQMSAYVSENYRV